jgi:hypothetical protein
MMLVNLTRGARRYDLSLDVDLFDAIVLTRHWYGENSRRHGRRQELFTDMAQAQARFSAVRVYLLKCGYVLPVPTHSARISLESENRGHDGRWPTCGF